MRRAARARWRKQGASALGSAAESRAEPAVRPKLPRPALLASRWRSERSHATSVFPTGLYRFIDERYQRLTFERLAQEAQCTGIHRARAHPLLRKRGHEDDGDVAILRQQR